MDTFTRAAQAAGRQIQDMRVCCTKVTPQDLAKAERKNALFVHRSMWEYLEQYLVACSIGVRHTLLYSRRFGNGPSPHMSGFLDFWMEQGGDIGDLRDIDKTMQNISSCQ